MGDTVQSKQIICLFGMINSKTAGRSGIAPGKEGPMKANEQHIIDAIATYLCIKAIEQERIVSSIDTTPIAVLLNANSGQREKGLYRAREMIRDFTRW